MPEARKPAIACTLRRRDSFDFDWKFFRGDPRAAEQLDFQDRAWADVSLPHDWSIEGPFRQDAPGGGSHGWAPHGVGWYRKHFDLPASDADRAIWIEFDGVYHNSDVWINGHHLGGRAYGYSSFHYDLSPHLSSGRRNVLAVRVDNSDVPNGRWYSGSGIYRHVWLTTTAATARLAHWGTCVTTPKISRQAATVRVRTQVEGDANIVLETTILDSRGRKIASQGDRGRREFDQTLVVKRPRLWSIEDPAMYFVRSIVHVDGRPVDDLITPLGIRSIRFDSRKGFLLNGRTVKMKGVCLHHDGGCVGAAVPDRVLQRRLEILKEIGCNAIRCSHNPPSPQFLEFCDRMGFLVINEAFDKWGGDFAKPNEWWMRQSGFEENWERDLRAMLERDRNHPCIVLWSVGNETGQPGTKEVNPMLRRLVRFVKREEPTRPVIAALVNSNARTLKHRVKRVLSSAKLMDVLAVNYQEPMYPHYRAANPRLVICGTEAFKHWRGGEMLIHSFDPVNPWYDVARHDYVTGQFLWPGIDYLGESNTWPLRGWPTGIIDTCGFVKPESWFQRSVWRSDPIVRIGVFVGSAGETASSWSAPAMVEHWNFAHLQDKLLCLRTQTNCQTVELLVNRSSYGVRRAADFPNSAPIWHVPYKPGKVEAIGRIGRRIVARHQLTTAGPVAAISLTADHLRIAADGQDVAHVEVTLADARGVLVPEDGRAIHFELSGPGRSIGMDNGDLASLEPYKSNSRSTRGGRCLAIVQSLRTRGRIRLTASADGLSPATLHIDAE